MNVFATSPAHGPAREVRGLIDALATLLRTSPSPTLDRRGVADRLARAVRSLYAVLDTTLEAPAHQDGLDECARVLAEARALLAAAADDAVVRDALGALDAAYARVAAARESVFDLVLTRSGNPRSARFDAVPARPFRASIALPQLHVLARPPIVLPFSLDLAEPISAPRPRRAPPAKPTTLEELRAAATAPPPAAEEEPPPVAPPAPARVVEDDGELVRRVARDCLEDIASLRALRSAIPTETWLDQLPFEQRLLDNIDAFIALGPRALPGVTLFHAEAPAPDPARAFAVALTLACIEGTDTTDVAIATMKQSAPEELGGFAEGFILAPSPAIDADLAVLLDAPNPALVGVALEVLGMRGSLPADAPERVLARRDRALTAKLARALGHASPKTKAIATLADILDSDIAAGADDQGNDIFAIACASLLRRGDGGVRQRLRDAIRSSPARSDVAATLLAISGRPDDAPLLLEALASPSKALVNALGRYGHVDTLPALLQLLDHEDDEMKAAAAEALDFITGAGLRETTAVPWTEVPPPDGSPPPMRTVSRVIVERMPWETWWTRMKGILDPRVKLRHGRPFAPHMIVDEIAASAPVLHRAEAVFELVVTTGLGMRLSPTDWVARQQRHIGELGDAGGGGTTGAWWYGGAALTSR